MNQWKLYFLLAVAVLNAQVHAVDREILVGGDFEHQGNRWTLPSCYCIVEGAGRQGGVGLVFTNANPNAKQQDLGFRHKVPVRPGYVYRYGAELKVNKGECKSSMIHVVCTLYDKEGKALSHGTAFSAEENAVDNRDGWIRYEARTQPLDSRVAFFGIGLYVHDGSTGLFYADDFTLVEEEYRPLGMLFSSAYKNTVVDGQVTFAAEYNVNAAEYPDENLSATLVYDGDDDCVHTESMILEDGVVRAKVNVVDMHMGTCTVRCNLFSGSKMLGTSEIKVERVGEFPTRRVWVDAQNRIVVNGKPFFPLMATWSEQHMVTNYDEACRVFADSPFNAIQDYDRNLSREKLDYWYARGKMMMCSMKDVFVNMQGKAWPPDAVKTEADEEPYVRKLVDRLKDHPGLLFWYVNDEFPVKMVPRSVRRRKFIESLDMSHPVYAGLDKPDSVRAFMDSFDVICTDPYPVGKNSDLTSAAMWVRTAREQTFGMRSLKPTVQVFDWSWYYPKGTFKDMRYPTSDEIRTMAWLQLEEGANGLGFFSYTALWNHTMGEGRVEAFKEKWRELCNIVSEIKEYVPYFLSEDDAPRIEISDKRLFARTWRQGGKFLVAVSNPLRERACAAVKFVGSFAPEMMEVDLPPTGTMVKVLPARDNLPSGRASWGGLKAHPAVVNAIGEMQNDPMCLSLRGEWDFYAATKGDFNMRNMSGSTAWMMRKLHKEARKINVPGCWESQGVGSNGTSTAWKCYWDASPREIRNAFCGSSWYRKVVRIPKEWAGRRVWIKVGGVNSQAWLWVNERQTAWIDGTCGSYKYEITDRVTAGDDVKIVLDVTNVLPSRRGSFNSMNTWGGIVRDIVLEATPGVLIDDAWVRGDFDGRCAQAEITIDGEVSQRNNSLRLRVTVEDKVREVALCHSSDHSTYKVEVPLGNFRAWSPSQPNLYWATIELLEGGKVIQTRRERFGVRKLEVRGKDVFLNGEQFFARGAGWHWIDPIRGMLPPDREYFRKRVRQVKDAGFNIVRFHTSCFWPEFFEVADEMGLMAEVELPYYADFPCDFFEFDPIRDATELWSNYRRYPSFAIYSGGNEGWFGPELSARFYEYVHKMDRDRLVMGEDTWHNPRTNLPGTSDFAGGPINVWPRGSYDPDRPFICHEYLNLAVKLDSRLENRYTGVWMPPVTRHERSAWLAKFGLDLEIGDRLQNSQHVFQRIWQKYGIEAARADPNCDGYFYWSLQDVASPQKGVNVGQALYDSFWGEKICGQTTAGFRQFNGPSCLLLDLEPYPHLYPPKMPGKWAEFTPFVDDTNRVFEVGETVHARFLLAHFGDSPIRDGRIVWRLRTGVQTIASDVIPVSEQAIGPAREIAAVNIRVPELDSAVQASLEVALEGRSALVTNAWDLWLFPKGPSLKDLFAAAEKKGIVIAAEDSAEAKEAELKGRDLVLYSNQCGPCNFILGWWYFGSQMGIVLNDHPSLKYLPHDGMISPLLFRILKEGKKLPSTGICQKDLIVVGEGGSDCFLYLAERKGSGGGHVFVVSGLDILSGFPEGNAILRGLLECVNKNNPQKGDQRP